MSTQLAPKTVAPPTSGPRRRSPRRPRITAVPKFVLVLLLMVFSVFPLYWMLNTAISRDDEIYGVTQAWWPHWSRLGDFGEIIGKVPIFTWLTNSAVIAIGTMVLSVAFAVLAGYALSRFKFHGRGPIGFLLFSTQMLPEALLVVPLYSLFSVLGLLNGLSGLVLANVAFTMPVSVWIIKGAIDAIPYEIEEAALVDGTPRFSVLTMVLTPLIAPSIAAAAVINFFDGWNEFIFARTFIADRELWPASVGLSSFIGQYLTSLSSVMAAALLFTLPAVVFFMFVQRRIVSGMTAGSVKG